jgi:predicted TIM-barrel fold metal-dependent hydrolase
VGPVLEAFGFERIIFGTSAASGSTVNSNASDWYELARESFAELGVEQDAIDAVFGGNAKGVYGSA